MQEKVIIGSIIAAGVAIVGGVVWWRSSSMNGVAPRKEEAMPDRSKSDSDPQPSTAVDGSPPNISGDSEGFNTDLFPDFPSTRFIFDLLMYPVDVGLDEILDEDVVEEFQNHWNMVVRAIASKKVQAPNKNFHGSLKPDGVPGQYTLRAAEIVSRAISEGDLSGWQNIISESM